jgi:hypothetical protein
MPNAKFTSLSDGAFDYKTYGKNQFLLPLSIAKIIKLADPLTFRLIFLEINDYSLNATEAETVITFEHLASGQLTEKQLASWFKDFTVPNA